MDRVVSRGGVPVRLTEERWFHIVESHDDLAGHYDDVLSAVEDPDLIVRGYRGTLIAFKGTGRKRYLAVVYKEVTRTDGFVLTAYFTSHIPKGLTLWPRGLPSRKR